MEFEVIWSDFAEQQLDDIFEYYLNNANFSVTKKLLVGILNAPQSLVRSPFIGQEEGWLKDREIKYRYLLFKNYKLIYSVDLEKGVIKIADVFDTRINPSEMNRGL
ncbi:type II toxin-antitoxin system RelE/ParE family toxin [Algoriphagus aquimarinus]|uniref:Type II toxin-antitoxin system RelE/ParE family toxin n=1 Tax=Algoriphagus aquimarinus TaxID=237018 RepID=A0A5C7B1U0_9BACT|nr:type II toxin-antitoxin system RelE/ParE family toxin [Algoriphagus aquimarinus]TXE12515.1 type II toxin-antitoxin system RelE/ParE family toxin [Algoriphagus aquimarinus]